MIVKGINLKISLSKNKKNKMERKPFIGSDAMSDGCVFFLKEQLFVHYWTTANLIFTFACHIEWNWISIVKRLNYFYQTAQHECSENKLINFDSTLHYNLQFTHKMIQEQDV